MGARELLERARAAGLELEADGGRLIVRPKAKITDALRAALRQAKPELLAVLARPFLLPAGDADRCHAEPWDDAEVERFATRTVLFIRRGLSPTDADDLAEQLVLRDRAGDDRVLCLECVHGPARTCPGGAPLPVGVLSRCASLQRHDDG